ncbi:uncharacterized protein EMH_0034350 [Eimeria mitis]|uniref:Uncharacterized protein n=1 Tax=Eimeria mitis TaxID=44415 RepID=U6JUJ3_9EIME|nr:uncharacterized protein EMH_0034350 [Eimeria mitis]CDJ27737.1 hypothetical protein EMH_0034350 [Eimeria mitis]
MEADVESGAGERKHARRQQQQQQQQKQQQKQQQRLSHVQQQQQQQRHRDVLCALLYTAGVLTAPTIDSCFFMPCSSRAGAAEAAHQQLQEQQRMELSLQ